VKILFVLLKKFLTYLPFTCASWRSDFEKYDWRNSYKIVLLQFWD